MNDDRHLALIDADHHRLVRAAARLLGPADAEDAVQDAYVRALEARSLASLNAAQAWLLTVVRHLAIDRLRRRQWLQQWLDEVAAGDAALASPAAESEAALSQAVMHALRLLADHLTPTDGALVLLHEVFELGHAEIAQASGKTEAGSRQQLRRALARLRQAAGAARSPVEQADRGDEVVLRLYVQALQMRDPQALWAMLRHPPISAVALAGASPMALEAASVSAKAASTVVQVGGQLGLAITLDGVTLCLVPLGVLSACEAEAALA